MWVSLIDQGNEEIGISLSGVKIGFFNSRLSISLYFDPNFGLMYCIEVKLAALEI
jgi:hypothetical protein